MKIVELVNKIQIPITNEESDVLGRFESNKSINKKDFSPREQTVANGLVNKNILLRRVDDGQIYFRKKI